MDRCAAGVKYCGVNANFDNTGKINGRNVVGMSVSGKGVPAGTVVTSFRYADTYSGEHLMSFGLSKKLTDTSGPTWCIGGAAAPVPTVPPATMPPAPQPPASAQHCSQEHGSCNIPAGVIGKVWYGKNGKWATKTEQRGAVGCNNGVFGDPTVGTFKECRYEGVAHIPCLDV